jgi:peptide/nickel transport system substrate-binding protein
MKPRLLVTVAVAAAIASVFVATSGAARERAAATIPQVTVGFVGGPGAYPGLDFSRAGAAGAYPFSGLAQESLLVPVKGGALRPALASSFTQPNPSVFVFRLRHGVRFSDGSVMTSADVVNSLNYWRRPTSQDAYAYTSVKSIRAVGPWTVTITLKHPDASLISNLANFAGSIFEKKFFDAHKATFGLPGTLTVGTGPFVPVSFDPTRGIEYKANPHYWGGKVAIQHLSIKFFADETSEALAFRAGEIDAAFLISNAKAFSSTANTKVLGFPGCGETDFAMNVQVAPWSDIHVRRAVAYAINRQSYISANGGYSTPNYYIYPVVLLRALGSAAQVSTALQSIPVYKYDLAKAKAELAQSAYPHGFSATLPEPSSLSQDSQILVGQLQAIGIHLTIQSVTDAEWFKVTEGPIAHRPPNVMASGCSGIIDPSFYNWMLGTAAPGGFNYAAYYPAAWAKLISQSLTITNSAKRLAVYAKMLKMLGTDVPYVPIYLVDEKLAISKKFSWPTFDKNWVARPWALGIKTK